ncbi:MAG: hypothetical protein LBR64_01560 [Dysgonamonadaceae bacterium]|jgi:hypothetical protein|nr:hypothetical protein [Dysgonamonadaceae bacterium]
MAKIREDDNNIYLNDYTIPKGMDKSDLKARENIIWAMIGKWISKNPLKRRKNINLQDFIYLRFDGMQETVNKAARNYKSTMAISSLDYILENAVKSGTDKPMSKRQSVFAEMIIMYADTKEYLPYFEKVKMLVGITKQKKDAKKIQYSITAIEPV